MKRKERVPILFVFCIFMALTTVPAVAVDATKNLTGEEKGESLTEINKKLTNPVSEAWSISFQQNNYRMSTIPG